MTVVYDAFMSKRRFLPPAQERLMVSTRQTKLVELCVKTQNMPVLKETLAAFRNVSQNLSPSSFQKVIDELRVRAEAQVASLAVDAISDLHDLEAEDLPDEVLIGSVGPVECKSARKAALKFLWETYKVSLDLLKANGKMVNVYEETARFALKFCMHYGRATECRHFCETLHLHLHSAIKNFKTPPVGLQLTYLHDFNDDETVLHLVNVRLAALEACLELHLYQEAFRVSDDLKHLMTMRKSTLQHLFIYWQGLARVFLKADQPLLHAIALQNVLYYLRKGKKELTQEQNSEASSEVVLATLAVPCYSLSKTIVSAGLMSRLATIISASTLPTRDTMIQMLTTRNILEAASTNVKDLFNVLETEFSPLTLPVKVCSLLESLSESQAVYKSAIEQNLVFKVIAQLCTCYQSIKLTNLRKLFAFVPGAKLERLLLDLASHSHIKVELDYKDQVLRFTETLDALGPGASLGTLVKSIQEAAAATHSSDLAKERTDTIRSLWSKVREERNELLFAVKQKQEDAERVEKERLSDVQRREDESKKQEAEAKRKEEADYEERIKDKTIKQRLEKLDQQKREIYLEEILYYIQKIESAQFDPKRCKLGNKKVTKMTHEELLQYHPEEYSKLYHKLLEDSKSEQSSELKSEQTKFEHFERAKREIEAAILRERWGMEETSEKEAMKAEHLRSYQEDFRCKQAIAGLASVKERYMAREMDRAQAPFQELLQAWETRMVRETGERVIKAAREVMEDEEKAKPQPKVESMRASMRAVEAPKFGSGVKGVRPVEAVPTTATTGPWRTASTREPAREPPKEAPSVPNRPTFVNSKGAVKPKASELPQEPLPKPVPAPIKPAAIFQRPTVVEEAKLPPPDSAPSRVSRFLNSKKGGASSAEDHKKAYKQAQVKGDDEWVTQAK